MRAEALDLLERGNAFRARVGLAGVLLECPGFDDLYADLSELALAAGSVELALRWAERAAFASPERRDRQDLLGATLYLNDRPQRALAAWARGSPRRVATAAIRRAGDRGEQPESLDPGLVEEVGLEPGSSLTPATLVRARRRLAMLPGVLDSRVDYRIDERGDALVEAVLRTGSLELPWGHALLLHAARLAGGSPRIEAVDPTGRLERWRLQASLRSGRVRVTAGVEHPAPVGPGVWRWSLEWLRLRLPRTDRPDRWLERRAFLGEQSHWWTARGRVTLRLGVEQRAGGRAFLGAGMELLHSSLSERVEVRGEGVRWTAIDPESSNGYARASLGVSARTAPPGALAGWTVRGGVTAVSAQTPPDRIPRLGVGPDVPLRLRAREGRTPTETDGHPGGPARAWLYAGVERMHRVGRVGPVELGLAVFVDMVRGPGVRMGQDSSAWRSSTSVGAGLRLRPPGGAGRLGIDAAFDPVSGDRRISLGWVGR